MGPNQQDGFEPLYRHPQRQVVLPERKDESFGGPPGAEGWNACLDEFEKLNK